MGNISSHDRGLKATIDRLLRRDLGITLDGWILDQVDDHRSYAWISRRLAEVTDGVANVSKQTIAEWHRQAAAAEREAS